MNAGIVAGILSMVPGLAILALPLSGTFCVRLYGRHSSARDLTASVGFRLGARAGAIASLVFLVLNALRILGVHAENAVRNGAIEAVQRTGHLSSDQQVRETIELLKTPEGLAFFLILGAFVVCVLFVVLCGLGGAVSAVLLRRKLPPK